AAGASGRAVAKEREAQGEAQKARTAEQETARRRSEAEATATELRTALEKLRVADLQLRGAHYASLITLARNQLETGNFAQANRTLQKCPEELRGWEWEFAADWAANARPAARTWPAKSGPLTMAAFSADGDWLVATGPNGNAELWNARKGDPVRSDRFGEGIIRAVAVCADGNRYFIGDNDGLVTATERSTGKKIWDFRVPDATHVYVSVNADGTRVYATGMRRNQMPNTFVVLDAATGRQ